MLHCQWHAASLYRHDACHCHAALPGRLLSSLMLLCHTLSRCSTLSGYTWPLMVPAMFIYRDLFWSDSIFILIFCYYRDTSLCKFIQVYTCYFDSVILLCHCHGSLPVMRLATVIVLFQSLCFAFVKLWFVMLIVTVTTQCVL